MILYVMSCHCCRYYGQSHPTPDMSVKNLVWLSSRQALADLANFITQENRQKDDFCIKALFGGIGENTFSFKIYSCLTTDPR